MADTSLPGAKDFAKAKWKSGHRGRGRGRGTRPVNHVVDQRTSLQLASGSEDEGQDLASDHWAGTRDDNGGDEGQMQPKSIGADLAELLEQAHLQASQAQYRFRGMQQELMTELPPGLPQDQGDLLVLNVELLAHSLSHLPLHLLLGVGQEYVTELETSQVAIMPAAGLHSVAVAIPGPKLGLTTTPPFQASHQPVHGHINTCQVQAAQVPPASTVKATAPALVFSDVAKQTTALCTQPAVPAIQTTSTMPAAASCITHGSASRNEAGDDDDLDALLQLGTKSSSTAALKPASATAPQTSLSPHQPTTAPKTGPPRPAASAVPITLAPSPANVLGVPPSKTTTPEPAAHGDAELDELLGLLGQVGVPAPPPPHLPAAPLQPTPHQPSRAQAVQDAQSLEDWLGL